MSLESSLGMRRTEWRCHRVAVMRGGFMSNISATCAWDNGLNARTTAPKTLLKFLNTVTSLTLEKACIRTWVYSGSIPALINVHSGKGECRLVKVGLPGCSVTEEG